MVLDSHVEQIGCFSSTLLTWRTKPTSVIFNTQNDYVLLQNVTFKNIYIYNMKTTLIVDKENFKKIFLNISIVLKYSMCSMQKISVSVYIMEPVSRL